MVQVGAIAAQNPLIVPALSVVIPFFNEVENASVVLRELRETITMLGVQVEILAVNDGSSDGTGAALDAVAQDWTSLRVVHFAQNRGQAASLWDGFQQARGEWIAMLDGDGQNPPAELARLWEIRDTADMIAGIRAERNDSMLRRTMSRIANTIRRVVLRDGISDTGCSLKIFRRDVVRSFIPLRTMYSFLPAFAVAAGWSVREVPVGHRPRRAGSSKYGLRTMAIHPMLDMLALCWILRRIVRHKP
jgi:dolichol-phosphate mannosyltransferase